jgi:MFS family permease
VAAGVRPGVTNRSLTGVFAATVASGMTTIALPRFVLEELGGGDVAVGVAIAATAPGAIAGRVVGGRLTDRHGAAAVMRCGLVLTAAASALLLTTRDIAAVSGARAAFGLGLGLVLVAGTAWAVRAAPEDARGRAVTHVGIAIWGGFTTGTVLGEALRTGTGFDAVWWLAAALAVAPVAVLRRETTPRPQSASPGGPYVRAALFPALALALTNVAYAGLAAFLVLHLATRGIAHPALVFTAIGVSLVACRLLLADLPDRFGGRPVAVGASLSYATGIVVMTAAPSLPLALAGAALAGAGLALQFPALALVVVERVPTARSGAALGIYSTGFELGTLIGGPALGAVAALAGYGPALLTAALAGAGSALVSAARHKPTGGREREPAAVTMAAERGNLRL